MNLIETASIIEKETTNKATQKLAQSIESAYSTLEKTSKELDHDLASSLYSNLTLLYED